MGFKEDFEEWKKSVDIKLSHKQALAIGEAAREKGNLFFTLPSSYAGFYDIYVYEDYFVQIHSDGDIVSVIDKKSGKIIYLDESTKAMGKIVEILLGDNKFY
jgi:hypothetical protein